MKAHTLHGLRSNARLARLWAALLLMFVYVVGEQAMAESLLVFNLSRGVSAEAFEEIKEEFAGIAETTPVGVAAIFSYLQRSREDVTRDLRRFLELAEKTSTPVVVQLDGENWWGGRPDLWNWWDANRPGYSASNRFNVEWTGWSPEHAIRIAWRNWGRQIRVLPPPNLMSGPYREACHAEMRVLVPVVLKWWQALPPERRHLLAGIKLGWESSIGVNAWHYPDGNALLNRPESEDPSYGLDHSKLPSRGVAQIGFAAVQTAGLRTSGQITEKDLAEIVRRHLEDLCALATELGVPRDKLFTHVAGWQENELLYGTGLNQHSTPGWSFYKHAAQPLADPGVRESLRRSTTREWAAVEWLFQGPPEKKAWRDAVQTALAANGCRYVCIYNWEGIRSTPAVLEGIREAIKGQISPAPPKPREDSQRL